VVVPDNDITDELNHGVDELCEASYEMDPFDIDTPVGTIQAYACLNENVPMPMDKWFGLNHKTKDLRDQIDDKYNSVKLGYTKLPSSSSFPSRPPSKPPFPSKHSRDINFHEMLAYELLQVHTHELEPDPVPNEAITEDPTILEQWEEVPELESSFDEVGIF
jgi:hypothetical protein